MSNSVDPDATVHYEPSNLDLHCLQKIYYYCLWQTKSKTYLDYRLILVRYKLIFLQANYGDPDQTPLSAASVLGLHCLPTSRNWILDLYWLGWLGK